MAKIVIRGSGFVKRGWIRVILTAAVFLMVSNRSDADVGLCVRDDSLAKAAAIDASDTASGWEGGWGNSWTARSTDGSLTVEGTAACLSTSSKGGDGKPTAWTNGVYCWCNVTHINDKVVSGAWVFNDTFPYYTDCYAYCAPYCSHCVRYGAYHSCTRSALFAPL